METERDLAENAQWKKIQQNTFTRWANEHLKIIDKHINDLESDLSDGLRLIALLEVLSHKRLPRYNKQPSFRSQKLENVSVALKFLHDEGIKIVNIDSSDIVDCKLKLILGLIWTLILHYSISMPIWDGSDEIGKGTDSTPKQRLLNWIQAKVADLPINNFTNDWISGKAVGALVDACAPGLCPYWETWHLKDSVRNASKAMTLADDWLDVRQLIKPEELVNPNVDEQSMMTYLSQFPNAKLKPGAPLSLKEQKFTVYGSGIEPTGPIVGKSANFEIESDKPVKGDILVEVISPNGKLEYADVKRSKDLKYSISYVPKLEGLHEVSIKLNGSNIANSPYTVNVKKPNYDLSQVEIFGPGISSNNVKMQQPTFFDIRSPNDLGTPDVIIIDPSNEKHTVRTKIYKLDDNLWRCEYVTQFHGLHLISILLKGKPTPNSPISVKVIPVSDIRKVRAYGRGLQQTGVRVSDDAHFKILSSSAVDHHPEVRITGPDEILQNVGIVRTSTGNYDCHYFPAAVGKHVIRIFYDGQEIMKSPFEVNVLPKKESSIVAYGPGLENGVIDYAAVFVVETNGETGALGFTIAGPSQAEIECVDNGDGSALVKYYPTAIGEYAVHILCDNEDIPNSPYIAHIVPRSNFLPELVRSFGPGLRSTGVITGERADFTIDSSKAGFAPLEVILRDTLGNKLPMEINSEENSITKCRYLPISINPHTVEINYGNVAVPNSPYRISVSSPVDVSKVQAFGPWLQPGVRPNVPTHFSVDARKAGDADLKIKVFHEDTKLEVPCVIINNSDKTYDVEITPPLKGAYTTTMTYGGQKVPFGDKVVVEQNLDVNKIKVDGLESSVILNAPTDFVIDMSKVGNEIDLTKLSCTVFDPKGLILASKLSQGAKDDIFRVMYTPFETGCHTIELLYDNIPVPGSPFVVNVKSGSDPCHCKAYGLGLEKGLTNNKNKFTVETRGAGAGGLSLAIEGPSEAKMTCIDNRDGSCNVEYQATDPGEYDISIRFAEKHIPGSPFKVMVEDPVNPGKVKVFGPGIAYGEVREGVATFFNVDVGEAGSGRIAVKLTNSEGIPVDNLSVEDKFNGIYAVHYIPPKEGSVLTCQIKFADIEVPSSPFIVNVFPKNDPSKIIIKGAIEKDNTPASLRAQFEIDTVSAGLDEINVVIQNPLGKTIKPYMEPIKSGSYIASFIPDECGMYNVIIKNGEKEIEGSPFKLQAIPIGDAKKCKFIQSAPKVQLSGSESHLKVDAREAGEGAVTCTIKTNTGSELLGIIIDENDGFYDIIYTLNDPGDYNIIVKFGGNDIPNGTFSIKAVENLIESFPTSTLSHTSKSVKTNKQAIGSIENSSEQIYRSINIQKLPLPNTGGKVIAEVKMPSGKVDKPIIQDNRDGTVSIKYDPKEEGTHELVVKYNGEPLQGSPFKFHVDSITSGYVTAHGPGLTQGVTGEPCNFTISTKCSSTGGLTMAVEGPSKADINYHDNKDGTVSVQYLPTAPGEYLISVRFGDKHIKGSPFSAKITGEGRKRNQISVGSCSEVTMPGEICDEDLRTLNASIQAPSGLEEPCFLKRMPSGNIGISFTPREIGEHLVSVKRMGKHISNSPFKVTVCEREVGDSKKVKVSGDGLKEGKTHCENTFGVDTRNAGFGGLSVSIEGPSKAEIQCLDKEDGTLDISYKPSEPGYYIINLKFADHHVDGSPFTVKVLGEGSNRKREKIQRERDAVPITEIGSKCKLTFKMPGITSFDLAACVTSPGNVTEDAEIQEVEDGLYSVHFIPKELGIHTVSVRYKDIHIPGSPFQFTVGPLRDFGSHLVKAGGSGLERGTVGEASEFNVWTREAGGGSLAISVEGPSKAEIEFKDRKDGSCDVSYNVAEPGEYRIGLKFNDRHIPDSPFKVYISPHAGDAHKLEVQQFPQGNIQADAPYQFLVRKNGAKGELDAKIVAPSGTDDDCFIQSIDNEMYSVRFYPRENGIHAIHVKFNGVHIPESPFRIKVGKDVADPAAVHATGPGLDEVRTGHKTDFIINTCNAGVGTLSVTIDGPSKVSMDCTEVEEGYKVRYTPLLPGEYYASVKYNNMHIVGSPFRISCIGEKLADEGAQETSTVIVDTVQKIAKTGKNAGVHMPTFKSDASKITSKGMGLKKAYIGKQNQFTVAATDAGNNILYVGMYGPKGPCEEFNIKHAGRNNYNVNYSVRDRGQYILIVKWGEDHIPGSPFQIEV